MVVTGLVVGAVAIGAYAYVSQSDEDWLSTDELGLTRDEGSSVVRRSDTISGVVTSGTANAHSNSAAARANSLKAARNSLLRDDVTAARAQLNMIRSPHKDDAQVAALEKEVQTRSDSEQSIQAQGGGVAPAISSALPSLALAPSASLAARSGHAREYANHVNRAADHAMNRRPTTGTMTTAGVSAGRYSASGALAPPVASQSLYASAPPPVTQGAPEGPVALTTSSLQPQSAPPITSSPAMQQPVPEPDQSPTQAAQSMPLNSQSELSAKTVPSASMVQTATLSGSPLLKPDSGPKTRAEVRAELVRARENGGLPPFGNPDPAGPGGAPSMTMAPRP